MKINENEIVVMNYYNKDKELIYFITRHKYKNDYNFYAKTSEGEYKKIKTSAIGDFEKEKKMYEI